MTTGLIILDGAGSKRQWLIYGKHISAAEVRMDEGTIVRHMVTGEILPLTREESRQFLEHTHPRHARAKPAQAESGSEVHPAGGSRGDATRERAVAEDRVRRRANKYSKAAGKPGRDGVSYWRKAEPALRDGE